MTKEQEKIKKEMIRTGVNIYREKFIRHMQYIYEYEDEIKRYEKQRNYGMVRGCREQRQFQEDAINMIKESVDCHLSSGVITLDDATYILSYVPRPLSFEF